MKITLAFLFALAVSTGSILPEAKAPSDHPITERKECRKKADEALAAELKACKLKPKDDQRNCTMAALEKNSAAITRCGTVQVTVPPT